MPNPTYLTVSGFTGQYAGHNGNYTLAGSYYGNDYWARDGGGAYLWNDWGWWCITTGVPGTYDNYVFRDNGDPNVLGTYGGAVFQNGLVEEGGAAPAAYAISGTVLLGATGLENVLLTGTASGEEDVTDYTDENGDYLLADCADGKTWRVTPAREGYDFTPTYQDVEVDGADETGVNFAAEETPPPSSVLPVLQYYYRNRRVA